jgi:flagellar secretion chaperone FliS
MPHPNQHHEYITQRVQTASPLELIRILYEAALQSVDEALRALQSGDILGRGRAVTKTIQILSELQIALRYDVQKEYCSTLAGLYGYMQSQLIRAHSEQSESLLLEVSRLLHTLLEGWTGAMENLRSDQHTVDNLKPDQRAKGNLNPAPLVHASPARQQADANPYASASSDQNPYSAELVSPGSQGRSWQL